MPRSDQTAFVIEILEGPLVGQSLALTGRELPARGPAFEVEGRTKTSFYPGSREATQQSLGPRLSPTTFVGQWSERYLGEDRPIDLVELFEELVAQGVQLKVSWSTLVRSGVLSKFKHQPGVPTGGLGDIAWEATFTWRKADARPKAQTVASSALSLKDDLVEAAVGIATLSDAVAEYSGIAEYFVGVARAVFAPTARDLADALESLTPSIAAEAELASRVSDTPSPPARTAEEGSATAGRAGDSIALIGEIISSVFPGNATNDDGLEAILAEHIARQDLIDASFVELERQFDVRVALESLARPPAFTTIVPVAGTDLRAVAIRFYGTADLWPRIAQHNGLEVSKIPEGLDMLVIPLELPDATDDRVE